MVRYDTFPFRFEIKKVKGALVKTYEIWIYLAGNMPSDSIPLQSAAFAPFLPIEKFITTDYEEAYSIIAVARRWIRDYVAVRGTEMSKIFLAAA